MTVKVGKQENGRRRHHKKSVTSDNGDGGPTLSIAIAVREGQSTDKQDFAFDKNCSHTKRWTMAFFVRVAFDSTSRTRVVPVACGSTKQSSFTSTGVRGQRNRSGYDFDCHCQTKLLRHVLEQPLPVEVARLIVLNCGIRFFGFGQKRRNVAVVPRLPVDLVLEQAAQLGFFSSQTLLAEETKRMSLSRPVFNLKAIEFRAFFAYFHLFRHLKVIQIFQTYAKKFIFDKLSDNKNRLKIALQVSKLGFSPIVMP